MLYIDLLPEYSTIRGDKNDGRDFPSSIEADAAQRDVRHIQPRRLRVTSGSYPTGITAICCWAESNSDIVTKRYLDLFFNVSFYAVMISPISR
jgi:hypothetical protein